MGRSLCLALLLLTLSVPASASAVDPGQVVGGAGSKWISGDLLQQIGENCSILGNPYTETMVSGIASYGGTAGVPVVGQRYYTAFLVSVPGFPCGSGNSVVGTTLVLPPYTSIDASAPIRCFGQASNTTTFGEITGGSWSYLGSAGPYCPTKATPSLLHDGAWWLGYRPLANGSMFWIFVPVKSTHQLIGAAASPADGFRWLTDASGVYANPGLSAVWANVLPGTSSAAPYVYFARPAATPFWKADAPTGAENRVELFANLYTAGLSGYLCFEIIRISDHSSRGDCHGVTWDGTVSAGLDLVQVVAKDAAVTGPNGGYAPFYFNGPGTSDPEWDQDMKIVWTFTYDGGTKSVRAEAPFHTLPGPDSDGDGVPDIHDACPSVKGTLANGCMPEVQPDPDLDGVYGKADLCPTLSGRGALNGCPGGELPAPKVTYGTASAVRASGRVFVKTGVKVTCLGGASPCPVVVKAMARKVILGTLRASVSVGKALSLRLPLTTTGATTLKRRHTLTIVLSGTARTSTGRTTTISRSILIANPR